VTVIVVHTNVPDTETVTLTETGNHTGIFEGNISSIGETDSIITENDGILEVNTSGIISVYYYDSERMNGDTGTVVSDTSEVRTGSTGILIVGQTGYTEEDTLDVGIMYIEVTDTDENTNNLTVQTIVVKVEVSESYDSEYVTLTETSDSSGAFRGSINVTLDTSNILTTGTLEVLGNSIISVTYIDALDVDGKLGQFRQNALVPGTTGEVTIISNVDSSALNIHQAGDTLYVRLYDIDVDINDGILDTVYVSFVTSNGNDTESIMLLESIDHSGYFEGSITTSDNDSGVISTNNNLELTSTDEIRVYYVDIDTALLSDTSYRTDTVGVKSGNSGSVVFMDSSYIFVESDTIVTSRYIYVEITDLDLNTNNLSQQSDSILLVSYSGTSTIWDSEYISITETTDSSTKYRGSIYIDNASSILGNKVLSVLGDGWIEVEYIDSLNVNGQRDESEVHHTQSTL